MALQAPLSVTAAAGVPSRHGCAELERLEMTCCGGALTDKAADAIARHLPKLSWLGVSGSCEDLTPEAAAALRETLPALSDGIELPGVEPNLGREPPPRGVALSLYSIEP